MIHNKGFVYIENVIFMVECFFVQKNKSVCGGKLGVRETPV